MCARRISISTAHTFFAEQIDSSLISVFSDLIKVYMYKVYLRETMKFAAQTQGEGWISLSVFKYQRID